MLCVYIRHIFFLTQFMNDDDVRVCVCTLMAANQNNSTFCRIYTQTYTNLYVSAMVISFLQYFALYEVNTRKVSFHLNKTLREQNFPFRFIYMA